MQQGDEVAALVPLKALSFRSDHSAAFLNACAPSIVCFSDAINFNNSDGPMYACDILFNMIRVIVKGTDETQVGDDRDEHRDAVLVSRAACGRHYRSTAKLLP